VRCGGCPGNRHDGNALGERAGHTVERAQLADGIGGRHGADPPQTRVAVGRVSGVELVAHANVLDLALEHLVEERHDEVPGHAEQVINAQLLQPDQQVLSDGAVLSLPGSALLLVHPHSTKMFESIATVHDCSHLQEEKLKAGGYTAAPTRASGAITPRQPAHEEW
jgi:hypothetical protein